MLRSVEIGVQVIPRVGAGTVRAINGGDAGVSGDAAGSVGGVFRKGVFFT